MPGAWPLALLLLLPSACCPPPRAQEPTAPLRNLRVEPGSRRLTWDLQGNASGIQCFQSSYPLTDSEEDASFQEAEDDQYCEYHTMSFCTVTNYTVRVTQPPFSAWILFPQPDSSMAAAATGLRCRIPDAGPMLCDWTVGAGAPGDVQYLLWWTGLRTGETNGTCPRYQRDAHGTNIGCRFDAVNKLRQFMKVTVTGASRNINVPCADLTMNLQHIETLRPPNVSVQCNQTLARLSWTVPRSHFHRSFEYELQTQRPGGLVQWEKNIESNQFQLPNPGTFMAQVRARVRNWGPWTEWSPQQTYTCGLERGPHLWLWQMVVPGVLGSVALGAAALVLCKRLGLVRKIFPRLPPMKDPLANAPPEQDGRLMPWAADQEDCPVSEVQLVGEEK